MNFLRIVSTTLRRAYSSRPEKTLSGIQGKLKVARNSDGNENFHEYLDDDIDAYEGDFHAARQSYRSFEREQERKKFQTKVFITKQKYFKPRDPKLLTRADIDQIRLNHTQDPETWTVEEISNKFPISIEGARRIVTSPVREFSKIETMSWDKEVSQNWEKLRSGKLAIDPALREHVSRFVGRYVSKTGNLSNNELAGESKAKRKFLTVPLEDNKFIRENLEELYKGSPEKAITLVDLYRKQLIEQDQVASQYIAEPTEQQTSKYSEPEVHNTVVENIRESTESEASGTIQSTESTEVLQENTSMGEESIADVPLAETLVLQDKSQVSQKNHDVSTPMTNENKIDTNAVMTETNNDCNALDTYVKAVIKKPETKVDYAYPIVIPKNVYKKGMTYRIQDCYYDDDGEFLFRVPGVRS